MPTLKAETLRALAEQIRAISEQWDNAEPSNGPGAQGCANRLACLVANNRNVLLALLEADKDERVAALEAENGRLREIVNAVPISEMVGKCGWKNWEQARDGLIHALGKDQA